MKIADWLSENGVGRQLFAERIGVTAMALARYERGERIPERDVMAAIVRETSGEVTPNDFYGVEVS